MRLRTPGSASFRRVSKESARIQAQAAEGASNISDPDGVDARAHRPLGLVPCTRIRM